MDNLNLQTGRAPLDLLKKYDKITNLQSTKLTTITQNTQWRTGGNSYQSQI